MAGRPGRKLGHAGNRRAGLLSAAHRLMRGLAFPWQSRPADTNCNWGTRGPGRRRCRWRARLARNEANSFRNYLTSIHTRWNSGCPAKSRSLAASRARPLPQLRDGTGKKKRGTPFGMTRTALFPRTLNTCADVKHAVILTHALKPRPSGLTIQKIDSSA